MKTQDYLIIGAALVGGAFVFNKFFGKGAIAQTANEAGSAVGEAAGGAAGGLFTGIAEGALNAGRQFAINIGFNGMSQSDADKEVNFDRKTFEDKGTMGYFPDGSIYWVKNGVQTPSDAEYAKTHPQDVKTSNITNPAPSNPSNTRSVTIQNPVTQQTINALTGSAPVVKVGNNFATDSSGNIIGNLGGYATLQEARAYEQSAGRNSSAVSVSSSGKSPSGIPLSTASYKIVGGKLVKN